MTTIVNTPSSTRSIAVFLLALLVGAPAALAQPPSKPKPTTGAASPAAPPARATAGGTTACSRPADDTRSTPESRRRAAAEFKRGQDLIARRQYGPAIAAISSAYEIDPKSDHLYNLGVAHHLMKDRAGALLCYQKFLDSGSKNRRLVSAAQEYVGQLNAEIQREADEKAQREAAAAAARKAQEDEDARRRAEADAAAQRARDAEQQRLESERLNRELAGLRATSNAGRGKRMLGASLVLAGGAALGIGIAAALEAKSAQDELDSLETGDMWTVSRDWLHERGDSAQSRAILFSSVGAGLAAGGAVLYYLGERDARRASPERGPVVAPVAAPGAAGVSLTTSF